MVRPDWKRYYLSIAEVVARRGTCDRARVGCVIVKNHHILATGYNGALPGEPHCDDIGHFMVKGHCIRTVHAEVNAVAQAARHGVPLEGSRAYVTHQPCHNCTKLLVSAGIVKVYYSFGYPTHDVGARILFEQVEK